METGSQQTATTTIHSSAKLPPGLVGVGWRHAYAVRVDQQPRQQARVLGVRAMPANDGVSVQLFLYCVPGLAIDDGFVLPGVALAFVDDIADIDGVGQQLVDMAAGEGFTTTSLAVIRFAGFRSKTQPVRCLFHQPDVFMLKVKPEQCADGLGFRMIDDQFRVDRVIAQGHHAAHPHALLLGRGDLVTDALAGDLTLELGEREQHVEGVPIEVVVLNC